MNCKKMPATALKVILTGATIGLLAACGGAVDSGDASTQASQGINEERLLNAAGEPHNWLTHGGTFSETRFSALDAINLETIDQLDLAWAAPLGSYRGVEATPIIKGRTCLLRCRQSRRGCL